MKLAFVDCETTGLDPADADAWEIAVISRNSDKPGTDKEHLWQLRVSLWEADAKALAVSRYRERFAVPEGASAAAMPIGVGEPRSVSGKDLMLDLMALLDGAIVVGSNPAFDLRFLTKLFRSAGVAPTWHYRPIDIVPLAVGYLAACGDAAELAHPWASYQASEAVGVPRPSADAAHTALGDARWARDVYDLIVHNAAA